MFRNEKKQQKKQKKNEMGIHVLPQNPGTCYLLRIMVQIHISSAKIFTFLFNFSLHLNTKRNSKSQYAIIYIF